MTQPPDWVVTTPASDVHTIPGGQSGIELPGEQKLLDLRGHFWDMIFQAILKAIFGFFNPAGGTPFNQLASWASNVPFIGGTIGSAISFITSFLDPAKLLFSQGRVQNPPQGGWPKIFPFEFGELAATPLQLLVQNLSRLLTGDSAGGSLVSTVFSIPASALHLIESILLPTNRIAPLDAVTGLVPDANKPQAVQDIIDSAINVIEGNPIGAILGGVAENFFNSLLGIHAIGKNAVDVNVAQNALINQLTTTSSSGEGIFEGFDGPEDDSLPGTFTTRYYGSGGATGTDGNGNAVWNPSGGSTGGAINRHNTPTATDTQMISLIINKNIANASNPSHEELIGRCNLATDTYVTAKINQNDCEIGYVITDVYTQIGSSADHDGAAGTWDFRLGTANDYEFILSRNGTEVLRVIDSTAASSKGASYRSHGFVQEAGTNFFWAFFQVDVPDNAAYSAADHLAAA
jgi:hypothetical protein